MKLVTKNNIDILIQNNKLTPRTAICCYFLVDKPEVHSGEYSVFTKLLLQGTKTRDANKLADELEDNAIEATVKCKQDYVKVSTLFLNEDFDLALDIFSDIIENSTFQDFDKEIHKIKGEIASELDNPKSKASDAFVGEIFKGHYYENNHVKTLKEMDNIKKEDMVRILEQLKNSKKVISIAGDLENEDETVQKLCNKLVFMQKSTKECTSPECDIPKVSALNKNIIEKIVKSDANQAQVIQGWIVDSMESEDYPKLIVLNNILGASGLSSRLFCELRDKQGLAYTVRSSYEVLKHGAIISLYIATSPKNIKKSLEGFKAELKKLQDTLVTEDELQGAKENILGRLEYFSQTNMHLASTAGYDFIMGLGTDFETRYKEMINGVTREDVMYIAKKYFDKNSVTVVLADEKHVNM